MPDQNILELLDLIYGAGTNPACWPDLCHRLHADFDATTVNLALASEGNPKLFTGFATGATESDTQYYQEHVFAVDETVVYAGGLAGEAVHVFPDEIDGRPYAELQATRMFYSRMDWWKTVIVKFVSNQGNSAVLAIHRGKDGPQYTEDEIALLDSLIPHLKRAFYLNDQLSQSQVSTHLAMDALNTIDAAILVLDDTGVVKHTNRKAGHYIEQGLLRTHVGQFSVPDSRANKAIQAEIVRLQQGKEDEPQALGSSIPFVVGESAFIAYCVPYYRPDEHILWVNGYMGVSIFVFEQRDHSAIPLSILVASYGLTATEARILQLMVNNMSTAEAAEQLSVSKDAVRFHLKNMFQKTDTHRQSELVALVHGTLGKLLFDYP